MAYVKSQTGNLRGKQRKVHWDSTNVDAELAHAAARECKEAFELLRQAIKAGEPWAFQVFFGALMPKIDLQLIASFGVCSVREGGIPSNSRFYEYID